MRALVIGALLAVAGAAGCLELSPAQVAASVQTVQCERFLRVMKAERDKGSSCAEARMAAERAEPLCTLDFVCPTRDGGAPSEGGL